MIAKKVKFKGGNLIEDNVFILPGMYGIEIKEESDGRCWVNFAGLEDSLLISKDQLEYLGEE